MSHQGKNNQISDLRIFSPGEPQAPERGLAWCFKCDPAPRVGSNKIVTYVERHDWLGHSGHVLEVISDDEIQLFELGLHGNLRRIRRFIYQYMRLVTPEQFLREYMAPAFKRRRRR